MFGRFAIYFAMLIVGLGIGGLVAWRMTGTVDRSAGEGPGPWRSQAGVGEGRATSFQRATIARTGIWALPTSEVIYFIAEHDDDGQPLDATCHYRLVANGEPDTRWWSINAYRDYFWIDNPIDRYSFTGTTVQYDALGGYVIDAAPEEVGTNWLPLSDTPGRLTFLFRLYQPSPLMADNLGSVVLPKIERVTCE